LKNLRIVESRRRGAKDLLLSLGKFKYPSSKSRLSAVINLEQRRQPCFTRALFFTSCLRQHSGVERLDLLGLLRWTEELVSSEIWQRIRWTADFSGTGIQTETKNGGKLAPEKNTEAINCAKIENLATDIKFLFYIWHLAVRPWLLINSYLYIKVAKSFFNAPRSKR
jgi:hypothetical protein